MTTSTDYQKTNKTLTLSWGWNRKWFSVRKGARVRPASNLPEGRGYWLVTIPKALKDNKDFLSWHDTYGFLIENEDVVGA
jgi:hypothetical protein